MLKFPLIILLIANLLQISAGQNVSYSGFRVFRVVPNNIQKKDIEQLRSIDGFDFWASGQHNEYDIMVHPKQHDDFKRLLREQQIEYRILIEDVQTILNSEKQVPSFQRRHMGGRGGILDDYHPFADIHKYMDNLAAQYPDKVDLITIGRSYKGRQLKVMRISDVSSRIHGPSIFIDAGIHAREWIAIAAALYIIERLVTDPENEYLSSAVIWHIFPVFNPDGYEYTQYEDRLWRKTRSKNSGSCCGTDGNRNFDIHWKEVGVEDDECSDIYPGSHPFSEQETKAFVDYVTPYKRHIKLYLSIHSYGNYMLYPWGFTTDADADNAEELDGLANEANRAQVRAGGDSYRVGNSAKTLYPTGGSSDDWMKYTLNVPLSYTLELTNTTLGFIFPHDAAGGSDDWMMAKAGALYSYTVELTDTISGFCLPSKMIWPTVKKFFEAVRVFGNHIKNLST